MNRPAIIILCREQQESEWLSDLIFPDYSFMLTADCLKAYRFCKKLRTGIVLVAPSMLRPTVISALKKEMPHTPIIGVANEAKDEHFIFQHIQAGLEELLVRPDKKRLLRSCQSASKKCKRNRVNWLFSLMRSRKSDPLNSETDTRNSVKTHFLTPITNVTTAKTDSRQVALPPTEDQLSFKVSFFGNLRMEYNGKLVEGLHSRKGKAILSYLLYNQKRQIHRDILMDKFWPDVASDSARNSLNVAIHSIRKAFFELDAEEKLILFKDDCYLIHPEIAVVSDVSAFKEFWHQARTFEHSGRMNEAVEKYQAALGLYQGDLMEDDLYSDWAETERENLREIYLLIMDKLSDYYFADKQFKKAAEFCQLLLKMDDCREDVHRRLMNCLFQLGKRGQAIKQFYKCEKILKEELEVNPSEKTCELFHRIRSEDLQLLPKN